MALDEVADLWCSLFGYASCFYVPAEMIAVLAVSAALATFAVIAVLFGVLQKLLGWSCSACAKLHFAPGERIVRRA